MGEMWQKTKRFFKEKTKKIAIVVGSVGLVIAIIAGAIKHIELDAAVTKDNWSSTGYGAKKYMNDVTISEDGKISSEMSAQDLWDKLLENGCKVDQYLSGPKELARLMKAEMVTKYPDLRENPDDKIEWEQIIEDPDAIQGIIKFIRADKNNKKTTMTYMKPEEFQGYIDEYNKTGDEKAKEEALKHFTLKKVSRGSSSGANNGSEGGVIGDVLFWPTTSTNITSPFGHRDSPTAGASSNHKGIDIGVASGSDVYACEAGRVIFAGSNGSAGNEVSVDHGNGYVSRYLHNSEILVSNGDTVTKGQVVAKSGNTGVSTGPHLHFTINENGTSVDPMKFKYHNGQGNGNGGFGATGGTVGAENGTINEVNGDGYSQEYTSSSGITYKEYKQFIGSYANNPYWEGTIHSDGCGPTSVAILASGLTNNNYTPADIAQSMMDRSGFTGSGPLKEEMDALGLECEIIEAPTGEVIQDNLRNGKVMLVSVGANTEFTNNSHIMAILDINTEGQVYVSNPGNTNKNGWYDISEIMKDCSYIVVTDSGKRGVANSGSSNGYVAVVATWKQVDTTLTTNDSNVETYATTNYTMTTTNINYEEMVNKYTMPFELLWAIMVTGRDKELVFDLTDLVYGSDIIITVYDNYTKNTDIDEWHYKQQRKAVINGAISAICNGQSVQDFFNNHSHDPDTISEEYITTKTIVTQTNTINAVLTRANVWHVDYKNDYEYVEPTETTTNRANGPRETEYPDSPNSTGTSYYCEEIQAVIDNLKSRVLSEVSQEDNSYSEDDVRIVYNIAVQYYEKYIDIVDNITNVTNTQKYIKGVPDIKEKTDEDTAPNFVTIFNDSKNINGKSNIISAPDWLFEIIDKNETTKELLDLIKYLLYKTTGENYGVKEYDFSEFDATLFENDLSLYGDSFQEKVWFALLDSGFSKEAAAGVLGNIQAESGFDPVLIEAGNGIGFGLCQWSFGRRTQLENFAASKGKNPGDIDIQIEFLIGELTPGGGANGYANYQLLTYNGYSANSWINATTPEDAAIAFCWSFERPGIPRMDVRTQAARNYYDQLKDVQK